MQVEIWPPHVQMKYVCMMIAHVPKCSKDDSRCELTDSLHHVCNLTPNHLYIVHLCYSALHRHLPMQVSSKWVQPTARSSKQLLSPQERCEELGFRHSGGLRLLCVYLRCSHWHLLCSCVVITVWPCVYMCVCVCICVCVCVCTCTCVYM